MIRTKMHIKYARLNLQEAETAIQESEFDRALSKCRDSAISLVKAIKEAVPRENLCLDPVDMKKLKRLALDLMDSEAAADKLINTISGILKEAERIGPSRIDAERLLSLTGEAFHMVHDLFAPSLPEV